MPAVLDTTVQQMAGNSKTRSVASCPLPRAQEPLHDSVAPFKLPIKPSPAAFLAFLSLFAENVDSRLKATKTKQHGIDVPD